MAYGWLSPLDERYFEKFGKILQRYSNTEEDPLEPASETLAKRQEP
jgi:hypothetical protein